MRMRDVKSQNFQTYLHSVIVILRTVVSAASCVERPDFRARSTNDVAPFGAARPSPESCSFLLGRAFQPFLITFVD